MSDDALLSTPMPGRYGPGYGDPAGPPATWPADEDDHHHYRRFRDEHARALDDDYAAWRRERFSSDFQRWRSDRPASVAPAHEGPLRSFGRAISEAVTGTRDSVHEAPQDSRGPAPAARRETTERFFERS